VRRFRHAVLALLVAASLTAGCSSGSGGKNSQTDAAPSPTPTVDVAANTKQVCTDVFKLMGDGTNSWAAALAKRAEADAANALATMAKGLQEQAGKAANADLKTALTEIAKGLETASKSPFARYDEGQNQAAGETLAKVCQP
jgi:hypothetical protein